MNDLIQCHIKKIVNNGYGLATHHGKALLVEKVLPNETVLCQPLAIHKSYIKAEPIKILSPSPYRVPPACKKNSKCGGCDFSYAEYAYQTSIKISVLKDTIKRLAGIDVHSINIVPSNKALGYRSRIRLKIQQGKGTGFFSRRSNIFVPVDRCLLANFQIRRVQGTLSQKLAHYNQNMSTEIEIIAPPGTDKPFAILKCSKLKAVGKTLTELVRAGILEGCIIYDSNQQISLGKKYIDWPYTIHTIHGNRQFMLRTIPGCFSQVNWNQNLKVLNAIVKITDDLGCKKILDLYSGFGNIAMSLAISGKTVTAVEQNSQSIYSLKHNIELLQLDNITAKCTTAGNALRGIKAHKFDMCIVDPPRSGIKRETLLQLTRQHFQHILYLSCNPATLARDLKLLCNADYIISNMTIYDFFPQTWHIETLTRLDLYS